MIQLTRRTVLGAAGALLLAAGVTAGVHAQGAPDGPMGRGGPRFGPRHGGIVRGLRQLDLSDAQRQQVREVMQRYREQLAEAGKRLGEAHRAQRAAVETVPVNESLIRATAQTLATAQTDMAILQARIHTDVWSVLTPDQQEKAKGLKAQRETRMKQRRENMQQRRQQRQQG